MTNQEIFDECARHVLKQGKPGFDHRVCSCMYWTEDGLSCAIGGPLAARELIPMESNGLSVQALTEAFHADANGAAVLSLMMALVMWGVEEQQLPLLIAIQQGHDKAAFYPTSFIADFKHRMYEVATDFSLVKAALKETL